MRLYFKDNRNTEKLKDPSECVVEKRSGKGSEGANHRVHGVAALTSLLTLPHRTACPDAETHKT